MYRNYYINTDSSSNPNRNNEVHVENCRYMPSVYNKKYLGRFDNALEAVAYAKRIGYLKADGCIHCCPEAHRG